MLQTGTVTDLQLLKMQGLSVCDANIILGNFVSIAISGILVWSPTPPARCAVLLYYLEFLQQGNTINRNVVKVTLKVYLAEAASCIMDAGYPDLRFSATWAHAPPISTWIPCLRQALGQQQNWEIKAARKETHTCKMVWDLAVQPAKALSDSLPVALHDWMALGLSAAFRASNGLKKPEDK